MAANNLAKGVLGVLAVIMRKQLQVGFAHIHQDAEAKSEIRQGFFHKGTLEMSRSGNYAVNTPRAETIRDSRNSSLQFLPRIRVSSVFQPWLEKNAFDS